MLLGLDEYGRLPVTLANHNCRLNGGLMVMASPKTDPDHPSPQGSPLVGSGVQQTRELLGMMTSPHPTPIHHERLNAHQKIAVVVIMHSPV